MTFWNKKLAAWLHDPAEKALVLMRDAVGHEGGSVVEIGKRLGFETRPVTRTLPNGDKLQYEKLRFDAATDKLIHRSDRLAAGADRPNWPEEKDGFRPAWANVRFTRDGVLIHPLSGEVIDLRKQGGLDDQVAQALREASFAHFSDLIQHDAQGAVDPFLTFLAFWRFGPEPALRDEGLEPKAKLGELWRILPADTRTPDHSIWAHLDVVSALTGAMADGDEPALLLMSFGPVQGFIAQARSTSDLWAGSHLLSSLAWEGMKVVCKELGPDTVLFPSLRGVAAVDRWLLETAREQGSEAGWRQRFERIDAEWLKSATDANPLFAATFPNKFMALVPKGRAAALAQEVCTMVRGKAREWAELAAKKVFDEAARLGEGFGSHWKTQIAEQLRGFPEVHWSVAPWSLDSDEQGFPDTEVLEQAVAAFYPEGDAPCGFFADPLWKLLSEGEVAVRQGRRRNYKRLVVEGGHEFFLPNHGLLYPAVHELAERSLALAKALRTFDALPQQGYRCTLTGEHEWLTETLNYAEASSQAPTVLHLPAKARASVLMSGGRGTAWSRLTGTFGIKEGEHLGALATLKRLWPTLFVEQIAEFLDDHPDRFVVSTHTMALATSLEKLAERLAEPRAREQIEKHLDTADRAPALPRSLHFALRNMPGGPTAIRVPAALDRLRDAGDEDGLDQLEKAVENLLGHKPEAYYALIQMDGDRMGAWMAGNAPEYQRKFRDTWHPTVRAATDQKFGDQRDIATYMDSLRPPSPARHAAISKVLNDFSTHVARHIVEDVFKGKLIYAGGDDVLAMVSVDDLLPAMLLLRAAYSGGGDVSDLPGDIKLEGLELDRGFVRLKGRLMLMMGSQATASMGVVVAHHQAPLGAVLRNLRAAEQEAKHFGRNAFRLRVLKRSGGEVALTAPFWKKTEGALRLADSPAGFMLRLADALNTEFSRRAIYRAQEWLADLPPRPAGDDHDWQDMVASYLAYQFERQKGVQKLAHEAVRLAVSIANQLDDNARKRHAGSKPARQDGRVLADLLVTAEFFAREGRSFGTRN